jgi:hypothetical protein
MTEQQIAAVKYLAQVAADYALTLAPSVRGPYERECNAALKILLDKPAEAPSE